MTRSAWLLAALGFVLFSGGPCQAEEDERPAPGPRLRAKACAHAGGAYCLAFSPDGKALASAGFDYTRGGVSLKLWEVLTAKQRASFDFTYKQTSGIHSVAFGRTGRVLVSGSNEGAVKWWDLATDTRLTILDDKDKGVYAVQISPDGATLAAVRSDGPLLLWGLTGGLGAAGNKRRAPMPATAALAGSNRAQIRVSRQPVSGAAGFAARRPLHSPHCGPWFRTPFSGGGTSCDIPGGSSFPSWRWR